MKVFHGSPNYFKSFDYGRIGTNGTSEGKGFYFTDNKGIAQNYANNGFLYTVELNGNILDGNNLTLTKDEYIKLVTILDHKGEYLSNFGDVAWDGLEKVLQMAVDTDYENAQDDADLLGGIINAYGGVEDVLITVYEDLGYSLIKSSADWGNDQTIYIALTNDAINVLEIEQM